MNLKHFTLYLCCFICWCSFSQMDQYSYKRELQNPTEQWHKVLLPTDIFGALSSDLSAIRIYGLIGVKDTIEAPYILQRSSGKIVSNEVDFKIINTSYNKKGYYFTMEVPTKETINQMTLSFQQQNFDWKLTVEGSQNNKEWFTLAANYRILSIKNELTDYQFTKVTFPDAQYRYFRLFIKSKEKPILRKTKLMLHEVTNVNYNDYAIKSIKAVEKKQAKQTEIAIDLEQSSAISFLKIDIKETFDYYRPVTIKYITDSIKTEQGWNYNYRTLTSGVLNSIEKNEFKFNSTILKKLKIIIYNNDNEPLTINTVGVKGYVHELVTRFTKPATYYLVYGNNKARKPSYDLNRLKIPDTLTTLKLGNELIIEKRELPATEPLFKNKIWLWIVITIVILLLGGFSIKMMRKD